jgi:hypothetical protein
MKETLIQPQDENKRKKKAQEKSKLNELKGKEDILSMQKYRGVR